MKSWPSPERKKSFNRIRGSPLETGGRVKKNNCSFGFSEKLESGEKLIETPFFNEKNNQISLNPSVKPSSSLSSPSYMEDVRMPAQSKENNDEYFNNIYISGIYSNYFNGR